MPLREPDGTDPLELRGVEVPAEAGAVEEMVRVYAVEYRRLGWAKPRILATFRSPRYASAHGAWLALGEARVGDLVDEALEPFAPPPGAGEGT